MHRFTDSNIIEFCIIAVIAFAVACIKHPFKIVLPCFKDVFLMRPLITTSVSITIARFLFVVVYTKQKTAHSVLI